MHIPDKELHRITSTAIIHRDGKFLLLKRAMHKKAFPGKWTVPGGGLTTDDYIDTPKTTDDHWYGALEKALRREILEESGTTVGRLEYLLDITFLLPNGSPVLILSWHAPYESGDVVIDAESEAYAWATYEEAKSYDLIEGILGELKMVDDILRDRQMRK